MEEEVPWRVEGGGWRVQPREASESHGAWSVEGGASGVETVGTKHGDTEDTEEARRRSSCCSPP